MTALEGRRVVELIDERTAFAGRLLAELGADVIAVEPPAGSDLRRRAPFLADEPGPERSLRWWSDSVGKRSVVLDLEREDGRTAFAALAGSADIVIEGTGRALDRLGCGWEQLGGSRGGPVWVSVTPFGRGSDRAAEPTTDLTLLAGGGPVWNCGYDDHSVPPMRGAGDQAYKIGGYNAAIGALVAVLARTRGAPGQLVDVNLNAACGVASEQVTYNWLLIKETCTRQTGRHAYYVDTAPVQVRCADGAYATTGVLPRFPREYAMLHGWLEELGLLSELPEAVFLELAAGQDDPIDLALVGSDDAVTATVGAARDGISLVAATLTAAEFFEESQRRGFPAGAVFSPDEAFELAHFVERGLHLEVEHPELDRTVRYVGHPAIFSGTPAGGLRRPPMLGEHTVEVLAEIAARSTA